MKENEMKANDLFYKPAEAKEKLVPSEYIPVKLSSVGKLGIPSILHVRDYNFEEALSLSEITEENETEVIIQILDSVIFEDIDAGDLHKNDVLEILMTIQGTWYSPKLEDMPYYIDTELPDDEINEVKNIGKATLFFSSLKTTPLTEKVSLPIKIKYRDNEVCFSLAKVKNEVIAYKYVENKFAQKENELSEIKKKVKKSSASYDEIKEYEKYLKERMSSFIMVNQALLIDSYNGEKLDSLEKQLEVLPKLSLSLLKKYTDVISEYFTFGIDTEVEFISEELKEQKIIRRFDFRALHFLSSMEQSDNSGFDVSFG